MKYASHVCICKAAATVAKSMDSGRPAEFCRIWGNLHRSPVPLFPYLCEMAMITIVLTTSSLQEEKYESVFAKHLEPRLAPRKYKCYDISYIILKKILR